MSYFPSYEDFKFHEKAFNAIFATAVASIIAVALTELADSLGFFGAELFNWTFCISMLMIPVITLIAHFANPELKLAYYRTWHDIYRGRRDQRKLLRQFAKQYSISNWRLRLNRIQADGRWNFHPKTIYIEHLETERNLLMNQVHEEYLDRMAECDAEIYRAERALEGAKINLETAREIKANTKELLKSAKTSKHSGEIYVQRQRYDDAIRAVEACEQEVNQAKCNVKLAIEHKENLNDEYRETSYRLRKLFDARYSNYTDKVVKKISRIQRLKYEFSEMPLAEEWTKRPARKELA